MKRLTKKQFDICKNIKLVLTDVDGVLTDGGRYYSEKGEHIKKFHVRDGMGINLLLRKGIKTMIVTKENSKIVKKWSKDMNISNLFTNTKRKELVLSEIFKKLKITKNEIAFIGDDINDLKLLKNVGFSATPNDGIEQAKLIVDYVCRAKGGEGAFRELVDLILVSKFGKKINEY